MGYPKHKYKIKELSESLIADVKSERQLMKELKIPWSIPWNQIHSLCPK